MSEDNGCASLFNCIVYILFLVPGAWCVQYLVTTLLHGRISFWWALLVSVFACSVAIPGAIIVWILKQAGVL